MKVLIKTITSAATIALATILPAQAAFPALTLIYLVPGVIDSGSATDVGTATAVQCNNFSGAAVTLKLISFSATGAPAGAVTVNVPNGTTASVSTHYTSPYGNEVAPISPGVGINAGMIRILATRAPVFCTASVIDASAAIPNGVDLHMVRYNPSPGSPD